MKRLEKGAVGAVLLGALIATLTVVCVETCSGCVVDERLPFDLGDMVMDSTTGFWGTVTSITFEYVSDDYPPNITIKVSSRQLYGSPPVAVVVEEFDVDRLHAIREPPKDMRVNQGVADNER